MSRTRKTPEKAVPSLLARLSKTKEHALKVVEQLGELDDEILSCEYQSWKSRVGDKLKLIEADVGKLKSLISTVEYQSASPSPSKNHSLNNDDDGQSVAQETADHVGEDKVLESKTMSFLSECFHCLEGSLIKKCLVLLSVYPDNEPIKKRPLIYWWIGEGLVNERSNATAEEVGEQIFQELLNHSIIKPITTNSFTVYPWIRRVLIQLAQKNSLLVFSPEATPRNACGRAFLWRGKDQSHAMDPDVDLVTIDNMNEQYLGSSPDLLSRPRKLKVLQMGAFLWRGKDQSHARDPDVDLVTIYNMTEKYLGSSPELLSRTGKLKVLQMGRWQDSATHHIEAEDYEMLFERLGSQKHLEYLSLRGISRIETLPRSIQELTRLLILDLRACHNLIKLPEEVAELRSLTHLDVSECYLLDSMPKGLERLSNLQVLKGFVVSSSCKINDLSGLARLRKLSIRVGSLGKEQLPSLGAGFKALCILTVWWSEDSPDGVTVESLPKTLEKLDLRSVPFEEVPLWMEPSQLPQLEKLYIRGGKLKSLNNKNHDKYESVKFIRLNYLKNLDINQKDLDALFPNKIFAENKLS